MNIKGLSSATKYFQIKFKYYVSRMNSHVIFAKNIDTPYVKTFANITYVKHNTEALSESSSSRCLDFLKSVFTYY